MLPDLPESVLFLFFLLFFVIAGIYPAWQKAAPTIRKFFADRTGTDGRSSGRFPGTQTNTFEKSESSAQLSDYDLFVFRLLAQAGKQGLSRKQIAAELHLESAMVKTALAALNARQLIQISIKYSIFIRFHLSPTGYAQAVEQGVVPRILAAREAKSRRPGG